MFGVPIPGIDTPPVEAAAIAVALAFPLYRVARWLLGQVEKPHVLVLFLDLLRGAAFFPFLLLIGGAFWKPVLMSILDSNRLTIFMAGLIGAVSVLKSDRWMFDYIENRRARGADVAAQGETPTP